MPSWAPQLRYAPPGAQLGGEAVNALTFKLDQSVEAGHGRSRIFVWIGPSRMSNSVSRKSSGNGHPDFILKGIGPADQAWGQS